MQVVVARTALGSVLLALSIPSVSRNLRRASFSGRAASARRRAVCVLMRYFASKADLLLCPVPGALVVEIKQRDKASLLGHRHIDERLRADLLESVGIVSRAGIAVGVSAYDGGSALKILDTIRNLETSACRQGSQYPARSSRRSSLGRGFGPRAMQVAIDVRFLCIADVAPRGSVHDQVCPLNVS